MLHWSQGQHLWLAQAQSQHLAGLLNDTNVKNILDLDILGCNLTFYTLFSLSHRKLRPAIASTETSAMQWEARTRRPPNHFQLIEPEKGTTTIVIAPHKFMFCTYVTKRSHDSELSRICFLPVRAVRVPRKHFLRQFRPRAYCDQWGVGGSRKTMKASNASSSSTKSLAFHWPELLNL